MRYILTVFNASFMTYTRETFFFFFCLPFSFACEKVVAIARFLSFIDKAKKLGGWTAYIGKVVTRAHPRIVPFIWVRVNALFLRRRIGVRISFCLASRRFMWEAAEIHKFFFFLAKLSNCALSLSLRAVILFCYCCFGVNWKMFYNLLSRVTHSSLIVLRESSVSLSLTVYLVPFSVKNMYPMSRRTGYKRQNYSCAIK